MIRIDSDEGLIKFGPFQILWGNQQGDLPGFCSFCFQNYSLEFGEIDLENGIHLIQYLDDDVVLLRTFATF